MKQALVSLAAAGLLAVTGAAHSSTVSFTFQACGNSTCATQATSLDLQPGNVLALNGSGEASGIAVGTPLNNLYQANLNGVLNGANNVFANGASNTFFTVVASFREVLIAGGAAALFQVIPDFGNFFQMYRNTTSVANNLADTGFTAGNLIMSGVITAGFSNTSATSFTTSPTGVITIVAGGPLDASGKFDHIGVTTINTVGGANITSVLNFIDANYFPDLDAGDAIVTALTSGNLGIPFQQADPSRQFWNGSALFASNIGAINGITGPNFQCQVDAATSFQRAIPEPGSLALVSLALLGAAVLPRVARHAAELLQVPSKTCPPGPFFCAG